MLTKSWSISKSPLTVPVTVVDEPSEAEASSLRTNDPVSSKGASYTSASSRPTTSNSAISPSPTPVKSPAMAVCPLSMVG